MGILLALGTVSNGAMKSVVNSMLGITTTKTKAQFRTTNIPTNQVTMISDAADNTIAIYNSDETGADNGTTILADSAGKKFKLITLQNLVFNTPFQ